MSAIGSPRPSSRNQAKEAFWMSMRLGRSRTCFRRENVLRARGATAVLLKNSLPYVRRSVMGTGRVRARLEAEQRRIADTHAPPQPRGGGGNCPSLSVAHGARAPSPRPLRPFAAAVHR